MVSGFRRFERITAIHRHSWLRSWVCPCPLCGRGSRKKSSPSHEMLVKLCRMYSISSDYLLGLTDEDPAYVRQRRQEHLTDEERLLLREFEEYLIWKRKHK